MPSARTRLALLTAVALAIGATPAGAASYGVVAVNSTNVPGETVEQRAAAYRRLRDAGVEAVRLDLNWVDVEPAGEPPFDFDFRERDREVEAIRRAGLRVIGLLAYGHPDHSTGGAVVGATPAREGIPPLYVANAQYFPPDDPADFARYAAAVASHYGDEVMAWELWNEENAGARFWPPREDPPAYARLLCAAYRAVKEVDPRTPALYGGLFYPGASAGPTGMSGPAFLQATYDSDPRLGRCFDALAYHPYPYPFTAPELEVPVRGSVLSAAGELRAVLARNGDGGKPLWITEIGWPTNDRSYGVPERKQAQYVARMQAASFAQRLPVLTFFAYGDGQDPSGFDQESAFGFFRADGSPKPAYRALGTFARVFRRSRFHADRSRALGLPAAEPNEQGGGFALEYRRPGARVTALWLADESYSEGQGPEPENQVDNPTRTRVRLPVTARRVTVFDHLGGRRRVAARDGHVELGIGPGPLYAVDRSPLRLRLRLRYRRGGRGGRGCARSAVRARLRGGGVGLIRRVRFYARGSRFGVDRRLPFGRRLALVRLRRGRAAVVRVAVELRDGRRIRRLKRVRRCGRRGGGGFG